MEFREPFFRVGVPRQRACASAPRQRQLDPLSRDRQRIDPENEAPRADYEKHRKSNIFLVVWHYPTQAIITAMVKLILSDMRINFHDGCTGQASWWNWHKMAAVLLVQFSAFMSTYLQNQNTDVWSWSSHGAIVSPTCCKHWCLYLVPSSSHNFVVSWFCCKGIFHNETDSFLQHVCNIIIIDQL